MDTVGNRIESRRAELGLKKKEVYDAAGTSSGMYPQWLSGSVPSYDKLMKIANLLKVNVKWLSEGVGAKEIDVNQDAQDKGLLSYPRVIGTAKMGDDGYYYDLEGGDGYLEVQSVKGAIAIQVRGDSMHPAIRDGWYVIIEPNTNPSVGEYVLVSFKDGKKMVKEYLQSKEDCYVLMSVNGSGRITAMKAEVEQFQAISSVIAPSKHREFL